MPNPFANMMSGKLPGNLGNIQTMMQSFNQFANAFKGDPKEKVQELLNSGTMSQEQFNTLSQMANQFQSMMPK